MENENEFDLGELASALSIVIPFWVVAVVLWQSTGNIFYLFNFLYIGGSVGLGI